MTNQIDEWIVAGIGHCKPVSAEPKDVDVLVPENKNKNKINNFSLSPFFVSSYLLTFFTYKVSFKSFV